MDGVEEVVELSAGCLCCSLADGLLDILEEASRRADQYDRLVIETTGIADPSSILQVFLEDPRIEKVFELKQVICLADAGLLEEWLSEAEEALRQVAVADVILLNKIDTVSESQLSHTTAAINGINPHARLITGQNGIFPTPEILEVGTTRPETVESTCVSSHHHHEHSHEHDHGHDHSNSHNITTFTLTFPKPLDLDQLQLELNRIIHLYRHQVYRVKGYIGIPDYPNRVILQSARSSFIATDGTPWEPGEKQEGKLVFIGRGLTRKPFEKMFNRHMVSA